MDVVTATATVRTFATTTVTLPATGEPSNMIAGSCAVIFAMGTIALQRASVPRSGPASVTCTGTTEMSTAIAAISTGTAAISTGTVANNRFAAGKEGSSTLPSCISETEVLAASLLTIPAGLTWIGQNWPCLRPLPHSSNGQPSFANTPGRTDVWLESHVQTCSPRDKS